MGRVRTTVASKNTKVVLRKSFYSAVEYDPDVFPGIAHEACSRLGATIEDLAKMFDVPVSRIREWMVEYEEFGFVIETGQAYWDNENAKKSLKILINGFSYTEIKVEDTFISSGKGGARVMVPAKKITRTKKKHPPKLGAIIFWLTNRDPENWKNKMFEQKDVNVRGEVGIDHTGRIDLKSLSREDEENLYSIMQRAQREAEETRQDVKR